MAKEGIKLSPKHGLNPSVHHCFFCGEASEVVIPGRLKGDAEAPHSATWHTRPCVKCEEWMEKGVILISIKDGDGGDPNPYKTGGFVVIRDDALARMADAGTLPRDMVNKFIERRVGFIEDGAWLALGLPTTSGKEDETVGN